MSARIDHPRICHWSIWRSAWARETLLGTGMKCCTDSPVTVSSVIYWMLSISVRVCQRRRLACLLLPGLAGCRISSTCWAFGISCWVGWSICLLVYWPSGLTTWAGSFRRKVCWRYSRHRVPQSSMPASKGCSNWSMVQFSSAPARSSKFSNWGWTEGICRWAFSSKRKEISPATLTCQHSASCSRLD